jgi:HPt (histidine-containing phosphotransfer) domain-containing protein
MDVTDGLAVGTQSRRFNDDGASPSHPTVHDGAEGPIDSELIAPLRDLGSGDFHELIRLFLDEAASRVARLRAMRDQGDLASLAGIAHTLRGTSAAFGATRLGALCAAIEEARSGDSTINLSKLVDDVTREFDLVSAALGEELR